MSTIERVDRRVDSHVHVFDPARFPYADDVRYRPAGPEIATAAHLAHVLEAHRVTHALIVGPNSGYNLDNRCLLDALALGAGRYKGIAVVRHDASRDELQELQGRGVVGVAFLVAPVGVEPFRGIGPLLERLRDLGMWADVQVQHDQLASLRPLLDDAGVQVVIDHCGRPDPRLGVDQSGFSDLLSMAGTGRVCVKLSSYAKSSALPYPHADAWPFVQALLDAYTPRSLVWGSDWPFIRAQSRIDYGTEQALFDRLVPSADDRQAIFWDTPARLFGFGA